MSNVNTKNTSVKINAEEVEVLVPAVEVKGEVSTAEVVAAAVNDQSTKKAIKKAREFSVSNVLGASAIAVAGTVAEMIMTNKFIADHNSENVDGRYSAIEIIGTGVATGLIAAAAQTAVNYAIPKVNVNDIGGLVSASFTGNTAMVVSSVARNTVLSAIRKQFSDIEAAVEEPAV